MARGTPPPSQYMPKEATVVKEPSEPIPTIVKKKEFMRTKLHPTLQKAVKDLGCQLGLPVRLKTGTLNWGKERK